MLLFLWPCGQMEWAMGHLYGGALVPSLPRRGAQSCPRPGNKGAQLDIFPPPLKHIHAQSLLRISWRDSESFCTISRSPWAFFGAGRLACRASFLITNHCGWFYKHSEQAPLCLSENLIFHSADPHSMVPSTGLLHSSLPLSS